MKKVEVTKGNDKYEARMVLEGCGWEMVITYNREDDEFKVRLVDGWGECFAEDDFIDVEVYLKGYLDRVIDSKIRHKEVIDEDEPKE